MPAEIAPSPGTNTPTVIPHIVRPVWVEGLGTCISGEKHLAAAAEPGDHHSGDGMGWAVPVPITAPDTLVCVPRYPPSRPSGLSLAEVTHVRLTARKIAVHTHTQSQTERDWILQNLHKTPSNLCFPHERKPPSGNKMQDSWALLLPLHVTGGD